MSGDEYPGKAAYRGTVAARYDEERGGESIWAVEHEFIRKWTSSLPTGKSVLDVPAGTGRFLELFLAHGLKVTALDVSSDMISEIHRRHPNVAKNVKVEIGDAERLDLSNDSIDYVVSWRFFHLIPRAVADRVLREFRRVCRGTVVVQVFAVRPAYWRRVVRRLWRGLLPAARRMPPSAAAGAAPSPWSHIENFSHTETGLRAGFKQAGFTVEKAVTLSVQDGLSNRVFFLRRRRSPV